MVKNRLHMVFTDCEYERLTIKESGDNQLKIIADVHGMKCSEAKRFINNIINIVHTAFQLIIIHGFNHGTAIKDMLADNFSNPHIQAQFMDSHNQGMTHMMVV